MKFYNLFNLFSRKNKDNTNINEDIPLTYIKYYLSTEGVKIDVNIKDTSDESIHYLATLLNTLSAQDSFQNTLQIIENFFLAEGEYEPLIKLYSALDQSIIKQRLNKSRENIPYIKPSEMIR